MEKLAISKAIMDRHNQMSRGGASQTLNTSYQAPELQSFDAPEVRYNIPQELMSESKPLNTTPQVATKDRILSSKLPDEIKKLMMENPIVPVNPMAPSNTVLTDELVEKATRLMGRTNESRVPEKSKEVRQNSNSGDLKQMMKEVVKEVLQENGLILESSSKTNETVIIKVGQHIFEGKISKIKKTK